MCAICAEVTASFEMAVLAIQETRHLLLKKSTLLGHFSPALRVHDFVKHF